MQNRNRIKNFACLPARQGFCIFILSRCFLFLYASGSRLFLSGIFAFCILGLFSGCGQKDSLEQAQDFVLQSKSYYQRAVAQFQDLIAQGKDLDKLRFLLGKLYYEHGDFSRAAEEFRKTNDPQAKKFLGISYYRTANFTDALEVFSKNEPLDDEYRYFYGLACEKLNLFDQALELYKKIKLGEFTALASERTNLIEKQLSSLDHIKDISPQIDKILSNAPAEEDYPQAGALILHCDERIEVTPQNTQVSYLHYVIKILNERGKESFAETQIDYDSTFEKVELEYARTIKPDGTITEVGSRHIRDVSKYLNFPLYSNARVYIISFPEITEGASIEYKLKVYRHRLINKKDLVLVYPIQASEPIIAANFTLELPKQKTLYIKTLNEKYNNFGAEITPQVEEKEDRLIYRWEFKDIPQIMPETNMPPIAEINPTLLLSTFSSWQEVYQWWWQLAKEKIKADSGIKNKVNELIKGRVTPEAKLRAIYNFCAQKIRYVAVEYGQAGHEPHFAYDIFKNKYGDCKDQAILLVTMLKEAGISSWPVLIPTKGAHNLNTDFPAVFFDHCIAAVPLEDKVIFLDPTAETCAFGDLPADDQARKVLIFKEDGYEIQDTPLYPSQHNLIKKQMKMKIEPNENISCAENVFSYGIFDQAQRFWLLYTPPELIEERLKENIQGVSIGAKLDNYAIKNLEELDTPVVLTYVFIGPEYFTAAGPLRIMPQLARIDTAIVAKDERKYPIDFGILDSQETTFEFEVPANFILKYIPQNVTEDSPWVKFSIGYSYKDNQLYFKQMRELKKNRILENEYSDFKNFLEQAAKKVKQRIVLERIR